MHFPNFHFLIFLFSYFLKNQNRNTAIINPKRISTFYPADVSIRYEKCPSES